MKKTLLLVILIPLPVLLLAAVHPTHILRIPAFPPAPGAISQTVPLTRISRAPAALLETGLEMPELITNMAFDPDGTLWLSSAEGGPYLYSVRTNELTNLLFANSVYGLLPNSEGVWVLTKERASLYRGIEMLRQIHFPSGVVPITGLQTENVFVFATSEGLFEAPLGMTVGAGLVPARIAVHGSYGRPFAVREPPLQAEDVEAQYAGVSVRAHSIALHYRGLLLSTDSGLRVWNSGNSKSFLPDTFIPRNGIFTSVVSTPNGIFAATEQEGFLQLRPGNWQRILFARRNLNLNSFNASVIYRNEPWFGTLDGSVVFQSAGRWYWIGVGEFPVTALATDGKSLYAWSGGKLVEIIYDGGKSAISSSAHAVREERVVLAQQ